MRVHRTDIYIYVSDINPTLEMQAIPNIYITNEVFSEQELNKNLVRV